MRHDVTRSRWGRSRPDDIRLVTPADAATVLALLDDLDRRHPGRRVTVEHGRLGRHLVLALPVSLSVDELAMLLARLEEELPRPTAVVARLGRRWLVVEAVPDARPATTTVTDVDAALVAGGLPLGAATMPVRELEDPRTVEVPLPTTRRRTRRLPG